MGDWIADEIQKAFSSNTREHWLKVLFDGGQPAGPIHTYKEVMEHEQMWANGYLVKTHFDAPGAKPEGETVLGKVLKFSETPAGPVEKGTQIGEYNESILKDLLKFSDAEVAVPGALGVGTDAASDASG